MIALVTSDLSAFPYDDDDMPPLVAAFAGRGAVQVVRWDDASIDWSAFELVVIRSTWGYSERPVAFGAWLHEVSTRTRLLNSRQSVEWNLDKAYLSRLAEAGAPTIRTAFVDDLPGFDSALALIGSRQIVVKPNVSAGSLDTGRFERSDPAARELAGRVLTGGKRVMLQPYYESVGARGEVAVVYVNGAFSHAFSKGPLLAVGGGFVSGGYREQLVAFDPPALWTDAAERVLSCYRTIAGTDPALAGAEPPLYARVDLIEGESGEPLCLELELIEPSLSFATDPPSAARFVDAVLARL